MANLRLDTLNNMDPGSPEPIGTLTEIRALALRPIKYGSCSLPSKNNIGCKHYESPEHGPCPVLQLCRAKNRKGFENVAFVRILSPAVMKQDACRCHQYMDTLAHADPKNGVSHIIGLGGEAVIKRRSSVPIDPNNPKSGMRTVLAVEHVPAAPRPAESMADRAATMDLAKSLEVQSTQSLMGLMGAGGRGPEVPAEDRMDEPDELSEESDAELGGLEDEAPEGDVALEDDDVVDDEDVNLEDEEPAVIKQISGRGRKRG